MLRKIGHPSYNHKAISIIGNYRNLKNNWKAEHAMERPEDGVEEISELVAGELANLALQDKMGKAEGTRLQDLNHKAISIIVNYRNLKNN